MRWIAATVSIVALFGQANGQVASVQSSASQAIQNGEYTRALEELSGAIQEEPENAYSHYLAALAYLDGKIDIDKASYHLAEAERYGAQAQPVALLRARRDAQKGDDDRALDEIDALAEAGYAQPSRLENQSDFDGLRGNTRFQDALSRIAAARFPCEADSRHNDFDFWIGEWDVFQGGVYAGHNSISSILGGCLIFEEWQSANGGKGKSFNYFDPGRDHWRQIWIADNGSMIEFTGQARDGGIFYTAETIDPATGDVTHHRFEFTPQPGNEVRQFWAISSDKVEWTTVWDGQYRPTSQ